MRVLLISLLLSVMPVATTTAQSGHDEAAPAPPPTSSADPATPKGYVQAALIAIVQPSGVANHRVSPPISGTTLGLGVAAGVIATPALSIEGEFVVGRTIATPQRFSYFRSEDYTGETRDLLLNGNVRWKPRAMRYLELTGGAGLAIGTFAARSIVRTDLYPPRRSTAPDQITTSRQPTLGGGIATPFPVSPSIEIVPLFRVNWVKRAPEGLGAYAGAGSFAYHFGTTIRFKW